MRAFEFIPGILSWGTILLIVLFSWGLPAAAAIFIILFDIYWLLKTLYFSLHLRSSFRMMRKNMARDWIGALDAGEGARKASWREVFHVVMFPMYEEPLSIVRETFAALARAHYPKDKLIVVLAIEERAGKSAQETARAIEAEFGGAFFRFLVTTHPKDLEGEIPGKGSNETWAMRQVQRDIIDPLGIPYERILVSVFDVDTQISPEYFGILTYKFLTVPHPQRSSFQPVPLFTNNIFVAPALARVIAFSSTFWHMIQQARPERLTTFSSHSMPFRALVEVGFWNKDIVSEDSQIFWQCYIYYNGDWRVEPIFYPVSMDANVAPQFWQTLKNLYKQQRRWAWGPAENIPYLLAGFYKNKHIPFRKKLYWAFTYIESYHSWATNAIIIFSLGWLPIVLGGPLFNLSVLSYNLPRITRTIMTVSMVGIVSSAILSIILLPPKPDWFRVRHYFYYFLQWVFMPITLILFGALPALEAQTRLFFGGKWRLGYWVTPKYRNHNDEVVTGGGPAVGT